MSQITKPIILDETGQDIATAISSLANRANDIENFTSSDVADGSATAWTSVTPLASGEVHSSIFAKISQMFKNIRYLYKMLGTTNISSIGGGTVTGAISTLNSNTLKSTDSKHAIETVFEPSFCLFRITSQNGNNTRLVFHDNGKIEILRYADGAWKAGVVLREADS